MGTWVANWIECDDAVWQQQVEQLLQALQGGAVNCVFVGEEVGCSVVPAYELGQRFRDRMVLLNRDVGAISDAVYLVTAGFAIDLRQVGIPILEGREREENPLFNRAGYVRGPLDDLCTAQLSGEVGSIWRSLVS